MLLCMHLACRVLIFLFVNIGLIQVASAVIGQKKVDTGMLVV